MQISFWNTSTPELTIPGLLSFQLSRTLDGEFHLDGLDNDLTPLPEKFKQLVIDKIFAPNSIVVKSGSIELPDTEETYTAIAEFYTAFLGNRIQTKVDELRVTENQLAYSGILVINGQRFEYKARCKNPMRGWKMWLLSRFKIFEKLFGKHEFTYELKRLGRSEPIQLTPEIILMLNSTVGMDIHSLESLMDTPYWNYNIEYMDVHSYTTSWFKPATEMTKALGDLSVPLHGWVQYPPVVAQ